MKRLVRMQRVRSRMLVLESRMPRLITRLIGHQLGSWWIRGDVEYKSKLLVVVVFERSPDS